VARCFGVLLVVVAAAFGRPAGEEMKVMTASDALNLPRPVPDRRLAYGGGPLQFGELRLPDGDGPHPVAIVIHGGCWLAEYDLGYMSGLADALTDAGIATWSIEYRRVGDDGGGWPGTFQDVADAADFLVEIAPGCNLDLDRVAAVGHSAGGHLALWLAGRKGLSGGDPLRGEAPLPLHGVVARPSRRPTAVGPRWNRCSEAPSPMSQTGSTAAHRSPWFPLASARSWSLASSIRSCPDRRRHPSPKLLAGTEIRWRWSRSRERDISSSSIPRRRHLRPFGPRC
jgi:hypothetical protein